MKIYYSKCHILNLGLKPDSCDHSIDNNAILRTAVIKDSEVTFDGDFKFKSHINDIVSRAKQRSSLILRCFLSRNIINLVGAFKTYVRPLVEYASTVWSPSLHDSN